MSLIVENHLAALSRTEAKIPSPGRGLHPLQAACAAFLLSRFPAAPNMRIPWHWEFHIPQAATVCLASSVLSI